MHKTTNNTIVVVDGDIMLCCRSGCWNHLVASLEWAVKWKNWLRSSAGYCTHTLIVICKHWQTRLPYAQKQTCRWGGVNFSWSCSTECENMLFLIYLTPYVTTREQRRALLTVFSNSLLEVNKLISQVFKIFLNNIFSPTKLSMILLFFRISHCATFLIWALVTVFYSLMLFREVPPFHL